MKKILLVAAALAAAWPVLQSPVRAESTIDRVLGGDDHRNDRDRQDVQRNQEQIDHARDEGREEGREDARQEHRDRDERRVDPDRRDLSGSSRDPHEQHHDND
jgi:hypothetical protein